MQANDKLKYRDEIIEAFKNGNFLSKDDGAYDCVERCKQVY